MLPQWSIHFGSCSEFILIIVIFRLKAILIEPKSQPRLFTFEFGHKGGIDDVSEDECENEGGSDVYNNNTCDIEIENGDVG